MSKIKLSKWELKPDKEVYFMVRDYIIIAVSSLVVGVIITLILLGIVSRQGIDIFRNLWLLAVPAILALTLNIILLELYRNFRKRK
ncbi:hypothetical protein ACFLVZ_02165 [Chloroflexota bacterium]